MDTLSAFETALASLTRKDVVANVKKEDKPSPSVNEVKIEGTESAKNEDDGGWLLEEAMRVARVKSESDATISPTVDIKPVVTNVGHVSSVANLQSAFASTTTPIYRVNATLANPAVIRNVSPATISRPAVRFIRRSDLNVNVASRAQMVPNFPNLHPSLVNARLPSQYSRALFQQRSEEEFDEDDGDDLAQAETYADYVPAKLNLGRRHPDPVVESSTLSGVDPPEVRYHLKLPNDVIESGALSSAQLEAVIYACQRHECILPNDQRAGFLIGDGAGMGKGREIAATIYENYLRGQKKAIWLSVSTDLRMDAERDLRDVGHYNVRVHSLNKFKYAKISGKVNGKVKKGVIFATYSSLIGESNGNVKAKYKTRLNQLIQWCGKDFDGVIVFDECHRAKNLTPSGSQKPTKTGLTVLELQNRLPNARIIYASATGATEPRNMAYMTRLGIWGPGTKFADFNSFIQSIDRMGVGGMELVAMDMKLGGMYIARQLSFKGVKFNIDNVDITRVKLNGESFETVYNQSSDLWTWAYDRFFEAARLLNVPEKYRKTMWGQFWSAHQRFFKYLCIAAKVNDCVRLCRRALNSNKCVVIGLQSTGEAKTLEQVEESGPELGEFVSTAKGVFQSLVEKYFPTQSNVDNFSLRGEKLSVASERSSSRTISQAGRAIAGGKGSGITLEDLLGPKNFIKAAKGVALKGRDDDDEEDDDFDKVSSTKSGSRKNDSDDDSDSGSEEDDEYMSDDSEKKLKSGNGGCDSGSSSEEYNSDLELTTTNRGTMKRAKKRRNIGASKKRKQAYDSDMASSSDEDDEFFDEMCDEFFARQKEYAARLSNSLWADESMRDSSSNVSGGKSTLNGGSDNVRRRCDEMKAMLLNNVERLGKYLPNSSLDELIAQLGGPSCVAEMTGRRGRVVRREDGTVHYEARNEGDFSLESVNLAEKEYFMRGHKLIAIVSEAASSGISLQADRRAENQKRRVHITLELPWSADRAIQQFGRTHRSNQVSAPEYHCLITNLAGEQRFASAVAKRLESLGALTHGDRRATETRDLSRFNIDTQWGRKALDMVLKTCIDGEVGIVKPPSDYLSEDPSAIDEKFLSSLNPSLRPFSNFIFDIRSGLQSVGFSGERTREKDSRQMNKFLNRILGLHVQPQNALFQYFMDTMNELRRRAKMDNKLDLGILDLGSTGQNLRIVHTESFDAHFLSESSKVYLHKVTTQRGVSWSAAMEIYMQHDGSEDGFYTPKEENGPVKIPLLAYCLQDESRRDVGNESSDEDDEQRSKKLKSKRLYRIYRPNTGLQSEPIEYGKLAEQFTKTSSSTDCQDSWSYIYEQSKTKCIHLIQNKVCPRRNKQSGICENGLRERTYYVLSGAVLNVWRHVEHTLSSLPNQTVSMQVVRLKPEEGKRIVGLLIPQVGVHAVLECLKGLQSNPGDFDLSNNKLSSARIDKSDSSQQLQSLSRSLPLSQGANRLAFWGSSNSTIGANSPSLRAGNDFRRSSVSSLGSSSSRVSATSFQPSSFPAASRSFPYRPTLSLSSPNIVQAANQSRSPPVLQVRSNTPSAQRVYATATGTRLMRQVNPASQSLFGILSNRQPPTILSNTRARKINWVTQDNLTTNGVLQTAQQSQVRPSQVIHFRTPQPQPTQVVQVRPFNALQLRPQIQPLRVVSQPPRIGQQLIRSQSSSSSVSSRPSAAPASGTPVVRPPLKMKVQWKNI